MFIQLYPSPPLAPSLSSSSSWFTLLVLCFWRERKEVLLCCLANRSSLFFVPFSLISIPPPFFSNLLPRHSLHFFFLCIPPNKPSFVRAIGSLQADTHRHRHRQRVRETFHILDTLRKRRDTDTNTDMEQLCEANKNKQLDRILKSTTLLFFVAYSIERVNNPLNCRTLNYVHKSSIGTRKYNATSNTNNNINQDQTTKYRRK